jgi:alkylated DNA nucleotide flippase Atl1
MGGGASSGGSTDIPLRQPSQEWPAISNWYGHQQNEFNNFTQNQPLLNTAEQGALANYGNLSQLTDPLMSLLGSTPGQYQGLFDQLGQNAGQYNGLFSDLGQLSGQLGQTAGELNTTYGQLGQAAGQLGETARQVGSYAPELEAAYRNQINPVLQSGGALTGQQLRDVNQQTLANASAAGSAFSPGTLGTEAVNAQREREARFSNYLGMGQSTAGTLGALRGEQAGIYGEQAGIYGQQAGIRGEQANIYGQQAGIRGEQGNLLGQQAGVYGQQGNLLGQEASTVGGLSGLVQGLQSGGLNQLLGSEQANVGSFTGLENPILSYLSNLYTSNEQASIAQAQINEQAQQASAGKSGGIVSGGIGALGAIAPALIGL